MKQPGNSQLYDFIYYFLTTLFIMFLVTYNYVCVEILLVSELQYIPNKISTLTLL